MTPGLRTDAASPPVRRALAVAWALLVAFAVAYFWLLRDYKFQLGDEGIALTDAWRVLRGDAPHRDFFEVIPPGSFLPTAAAFYLLGVSMETSRLLTMAYALGLLLGADAVLRRLVVDGRTRLVLAVLLIPFGVYYWPMPSHHWVADIAQMFAAVALLRGLDGTRPAAWAVAAGALTAWAGASLQDQGFYFALGLLVAFFPWVGDRDRARRLFLGWLAGAAAVTIGFAIYLLPNVSLSEFFFQTIWFPRARYSLAAANQGSLLSGWEAFATPTYWTGFLLHPPYLGSLFLLAAVLFIAPFVSLASLGAAVAFKWAARPRIGLVAALVVAHLACCLHRWSLTNVTWAAPPMFIALAWALDRGAHHRLVAARLASHAAGLSILAAGLIVAVSNLGALDNRDAGRVAARSGMPWMMPGIAVAKTQQTLDAIEKYVPVGTPMFCYGYFPLFNFLTQRPNPTRFSIILYPSYTTGEQAQEIMNSLDAHPDAHLLRQAPGHTDLDAWFEMHYQPEWSNGVWELLRRRQ